MSKRIPQKIRDIVEARSGGVCEGCGARRATEMHHRLFLSRGGKHEVVNLLHLCGWGNHTGCHGIAHSDVTGEKRGWALPTSVAPEDQPENRPVDVWDGLYYLLPDGGKKLIPEPAY